MKWFKLAVGWVGLGLAIILAVAVIPFFCLGFCAQGCWVAFQYGQQCFGTLNNLLGRR